MVVAPCVSDGNSAGHSDVDRCPDSRFNEMVAQVEEFFSYRPTQFIPGKAHTNSDKTREPATFDRHLDSSLRLRRVVFQPSLVDDLKTLAQGALQSAVAAQRLPATTQNFPDLSFRRDSFRNSPKQDIREEKHLEIIYDLTTAKFCAVVASTLEFQLPCWNRGHLEWTRDSTKSRGIADGHLRLNAVDVDDAIAPLSVEFMQVAEDFPAIAIWEFKSLVAGTLEVFEAIVQQAASTGEFSWTGCDEGERCRISHKGENGGLYVTGSKMAFDVSPENGTCKSLLSNAHVTPGLPSSQISERAKVHARHMTQQTWTEAVNDDTTFVVINAGNIEIIGKRERATQTLYISDVIDVTACDYGKLHTGLYIAAIRDARDRSAELWRCDPHPSSWTIDYCTKKTNSVSKKEMRSLLKKVLGCDWLAVVRGTGYKRSPFPFYQNSYWIRTPPFDPMEQARDNMKYFFRLYVTQHLRSDTFRGRLEMGGVRFEGIKGEFAKTVVIKYAGTGITIERLEHEYQVLQKLNMAGVRNIPIVIGLFYYYQTVEEQDLPQPMAALVMEDAGDPVGPSTLSNRHITAFVKALSSIHQGGFLHGNIQKHNLVIRNNIKLPENKWSVVVVGFGDALSEPSDKEKVDEQQRLTWLLPNPLKHVESGNHTPSFIDVYPDSEVVEQSSSSLDVQDMPRAKRRRGNAPCQATSVINCIIPTTQLL